MPKPNLIYAIFHGAFLLTQVSISQAQIKPATISAVPAATGTTVTPSKPADYAAGTLVNYIRTWQPQLPSNDETYISSSSRTVNEINVSTQYFDGLGRPLQTVDWQASPGKQDIVAPMVYDDFGREQYKYLPYTSPTASAVGKQGQFKINPFTEQSNFYTNTYKTEQPAFTNETFFYNKTNFEPSPLNRVDKTFAPGNSWVGSEGGTAEKKMSMQYLVNIPTDAVRIWTIDFITTIADNTNVPYSTAVYNAGELYKTVTIDEAGNAVVEYKDKEGRIILKKVQIGTVPPDFSGYNNFLCTYYIYDDLGQLRTVLQPKAVKILFQANNWDLRQYQTVVNELCFRYEYDSRQRMIAKKVPGAGWVYMVYDLRDRLVFSQDANMRGKSPGQWMYTLYDDLNRPVQAGIMTYTGSWSALQSTMPTTSTTSTKTFTGTSQNVNLADMYFNTRETGRALYEATNTITFDNGFTSEDNGTFTAQIITEAPVSFSNNVSVNTYAIPAGATLYPLAYTYYDDYAATTKTYNTANNPKLDNGGNPYPETLPLQNSTQTKGMVTVAKVRVIEDPNNLTLGKWMETVNFYDDKGRAVQVQSVNYKGGVDIATSRYDFTNKVVSTYMVHNNASGNVNNLRVLTSMFYDHTGRLKTVTKTINDDALNNKRVIATNTYDALGQLKNKKTGQKSATDVTVMEDDNYNYNIRGWLKGINYYNGSTYASQMSITSNKWFSMDLSYDWGFSANQYNGNIGGTRWKTAGDGQERAYGFAYDAANRLLKGDFTQNNSGWNTTAGINFSMQMGDGITASSAYDENGNIKFMQQYGVQGITSGIVDKMTYLYKQTGRVSNQLLAVTEDPSIATTDYKVGDFTDKNRTPDDYNYDGNGNLLYDKNKKITLIEYNHLNLPWKLTVTNDDNTPKGTITYIYDAAGNKLEKRTNEVASAFNSNIAKQTFTNYLGGYVYENSKLQLFSHEEGRVRWTPVNGVNTFVFDYFLKDHLGNVRTVLTEEPKTDMYPPASMEIAQATTEEALYANVNTTRIDKPTGYPNDTYTNPNAKVALTNGNGNKIGPSIILKVMAGDKFNIRVSSWYKTNGVSPGTPVSPLTDLALNLLNGVLAIPNTAQHGITQTNLQSTGVLSSNVNSFLTDPSKINPVGGRPKAYLNWILFDEQFKYVASSSGADQVPTETAFGTAPNQIVYPHIKSNLPIDKNGYLYVYVSNETPNIDVFFDNLQVTHIHGPLMEETSYYPFGLVMAGISSKSAGGLENKFKFTGKELQSKEFSDGSGLEWTDFGARMYDQQIGRWHKTDGKAELYFATSPYVYALNQPTNAIDPDGNLVIFINGNFFGFSAPGKSYWQTTEYKTDSYKSTIWNPQGGYDAPRSFDGEVMNQLGDHNARYYDGSVGGNHPLIDYPIPTIGASAAGRFAVGYGTGTHDAKTIIDNLARDKSGNITETIKIITHSMGGAYGKGFVAALKAYINTLPIEVQKQIKITLDADFDPHQAGDIEADPDIKTTQYKHKNNWNIFGMGWLANEDEKGLGKEDIKTNTGSSTDHSIFTFFNDISSLAEGTYKWDGSKWVKQ